jgi:hypothetical protein
MQNIDLANLKLTQGLKILGGYPFDHAGISVSSAGDINNDGIDDFIIGAYWSDPDGRNKAGSVFVIYGSNSFPAHIDLARLSPMQGFMISGVADEDYAGISVSSAGDVNHDGINDIIIGADGVDITGGVDAGAAYIIFGSDTPFDNIDLADLSSKRGFVLYGISAGDYTGVSVSGAGDINSDGIDDFIVGAHFADPYDRTDAGIAYVVFGSNKPFINIDLSRLAIRKQGFQISGEAPNDHAGRSVSAAGDINHDGIDDLIIGAFNTSYAGRISAGVVYGIYGSNTTFADIDLANFTFAQGFKGYGNAGDHVGTSISGVGDINGDGIDDFIISAREASPAGIRHAGAAYVKYGSKTISANIDLANMGLTQGFGIFGCITHEYAGFSVSRAGDINNDGLNDVIVGVIYASPAGRYRAGASYIVYGSNDLTNVDLCNLSPERGAMISGGAVDDIASVVSSAGDVNHDGINDIIIGAYWSKPAGRVEAGASYIIFGSSTPIFESSVISVTESPTSSPTITPLPQSMEFPTLTQPPMITSATAVIAKTLGVCAALFGGIATISFLYNNNICCFKSHTSNVDTEQATPVYDALVGVVTEKYE